MNNQKTLDNLKKLKGGKFEIEEIIESFVGNEKDIEIEETQYKSNFESYGECKRIDCYENIEDSVIFELWVSENETIVKVDTYQYC